MKIEGIQALSVLNGLNQPIPPASFRVKLEVGLFTICTQIEDINIVPCCDAASPKG